MNKNPIIAFLLAFIPGGGLMYLGKILRGIFYTGTVFGLPILALGAVSMTGFTPVLIIAVGGVLLYIINFIDTAMTASKLYNRSGVSDDGSMNEKNPDSERFFTIVLSFIPGLGHFQLGLVYRGITLLSVFLGFIVMILFVAMMTGRSEFLVFCASLPIIWIYGFFDVLKQLEKKQKGEPLVDRSVFEELENRNHDGRKSKAIATLLCIVPGAGHLYLGLQRRGIQLMAAFLFSIYILDLLRLTLFFFLIPMIWFYSFFDGLQKASKVDREALEDEPIITSFFNHQRWLGIGLIALGLYYLLTDIVMPVAAPYIQNVLNIGTDIQYWFHRYFQTGVLCLILIGGGINLMTGKKANDEKEGEGE